MGNTPIPAPYSYPSSSPSSSSSSSSSSNYSGSNTSSSSTNNYSGYGRRRNPDGTISYVDSQGRVVGTVTPTSPNTNNQGSTINRDAQGNIVSTTLANGKTYDAQGRDITSIQNMITTSKQSVQYANNVITAMNVGRSYANSKSSTSSLQATTPGTTSTGSTGGVIQTRYGGQSRWDIQPEEGSSYVNRIKEPSVNINELKPIVTFTGIKPSVSFTGIDRGYTEKVYQNVNPIQAQFLGSKSTNYIDYAPGGRVDVTTRVETLKPTIDNAQQKFAQLTKYVPFAPGASAIGGVYEAGKYLSPYDPSGTAERWATRPVSGTAEIVGTFYGGMAAGGVLSYAKGASTALTYGGSRIGGQLLYSTAFAAEGIGATYAGYSIAKTGNRAYEQYQNFGVKGAIAVTVPEVANYVAFGAGYNQGNKLFKITTGEPVVTRGYVVEYSQISKQMNNLNPSSQVVGRGEMSGYYRGEFKGLGIKQPDTFKIPFSRRIAYTRIDDFSINGYGVTKLEGFPKQRELFKIDMINRYSDVSSINKDYGVTVRKKYGIAEITSEGIESGKITKSYQLVEINNGNINNINKFDRSARSAFSSRKTKAGKLYSVSEPLSATALAIGELGTGFNPNSRFQPEIPSISKAELININSKTLNIEAFKPRDSVNFGTNSILISSSNIKNSNNYISSYKVEQKSIPRIENVPLKKISSISSIGNIVTPDFINNQKTLSTSTPKIESINNIDYGTDSKLEYRAPISPVMTPPVVPIGGVAGLPFGFFPGGGRGRGDIVGGRRRAYSYTPSFTAIAFNVRGRTGGSRANPFDIRPLQSMRRSKRQKKKR